MKIKTYTASTMSEAMDLVRRELGDDAIIVSTQRLGAGGGVRLTAAIEDGNDDIDELYGSQRKETALHNKINEALTYHGLPSEVIEKIMLHVQETKKKDPLVAFASALDAVFDFHPLPERLKGQAFMLLGGAGVGKTTVTAKLATRACIAGRRVGIISADAVRAGATEQLAAFTSILDVSLLKARSPENLKSHLATLRRTCDIIYIDMPRLNPFLQTDLDYLSEYTQTVDALPVLIKPAGVDPIESAETAQAFSESGALHILATRLDAARRFGGVLAAADSGHLTICEASMSPNIAKGLTPINALSLARLLFMSCEEET